MRVLKAVVRWEISDGLTVAVEFVVKQGEVVARTWGGEHDTGNGVGLVVVVKVYDVVGICSDGCGDEGV